MRKEKKKNQKALLKVRDEKHEEFWEQQGRLWRIVVLKQSETKTKKNRQQIKLINDDRLCSRKGPGGGWGGGRFGGEGERER